MALTKTDVSELKNKVYDGRDKAVNQRKERLIKEGVQSKIMEVSSVQLKYTGREIIERLKANIEKTASQMFSYITNTMALRLSEQQMNTGRMNIRIWETMVEHIEPEMVYWITASEAVDLHLIDLGSPSKAEQDYQKLEELAKVN